MSPEEVLKEKERVELKVTTNDVESVADVEEPVVGFVMESAVENDVRASDDSNENSVKEPRVLPDFGERYEALEVLGQGGMGTVYKAREKPTRVKASLKKLPGSKTSGSKKSANETSGSETTGGKVFEDRLVAIKLLHKALAEDPAALKRFEQEVLSTSKLTHPNLVTVYGMEKSPDGAPYLVMDYVEGRSLAAVLDSEGSLEPARALDIFIQIAEALAHAHEQGVIHRDVKPTNVILNRTASSADVVKIVDFGIAKVLPQANRQTRELTQTGEVFGSPHYMSPEQCLGFLLDQRSDIYSFGCLMYETLTGSPPFSGNNPIQLVVKHINEFPSRFSNELKSDLRIKKLESIVLKCLEKEQSQRFQTVEELLKDLELVRDNKPIPRYGGAKSRPTVTKQQLVLTVVMTLVTLGCLLYGLNIFGEEWSNKAASIIILLATFAGAGICVKLGLDRFSQLIRRNDTPRKWWVATFLVFAGMALLCTTPDIASNTLFGLYDAPANWVRIAIYGKLANIAFILLALSSLIGFVFVKSSRRVSGLFLLAALPIIVAMISFSAIKGAPDQVARLPLWIGERCDSRFPELALDSYKLALSLDPSREELWSNVLELQIRLNLISDAIETFDKLADDETVNQKMQMLDEKAMLQIRLKRYSDAKETILKAYHLAEPVGYTQHIFMAKWYAFQGMYESAIDEYSRAEPWQLETALKGELDIYLVTRDYQKAFGTLDKLARFDYDHSRYSLLRSLVLLRLGQRDRAEEILKDTVREVQATLPPLDRFSTVAAKAGDAKGFYTVSLLRGALAHQLLGQKDKAQQWRNLALEDSPELFVELARLHKMSLDEAMDDVLADDLGIELARGAISW